MRALHKVIGIAVALLGGSAMAIEKPRYEVVERRDGFEIRQYPSYVVAETEVTGDPDSVGNEAFSRLAGYIFGKNQGARKIAMTAPVTQQKAEGAKIAMTAPVTQERAGERSWRIQFMMPSEYTLETLPVPNDARVTLRELPPRRFAAIRYSGSWSQQNYQKHLEQLRAALRAAGIPEAGEPVWARYDPPFKPWFLRTNEILIPLS